MVGPNPGGRGIDLRSSSVAVGELGLADTEPIRRGWAVVVAAETCSQRMLTMQVVFHGCPMTIQHVQSGIRTRIAIIQRVPFEASL